MRIGIYVETAKDPQPTGIGLHVRELVHALAKQDSQNEYYLYYQRGILRAGPAFPSAPSQANFHLRPLRFPQNWVGNRPRLWWDWVLPRTLNKDRIDLFHGPNHFLPAWNRDRSIVTIHDLAYFKMAVHDRGENNLLRDWTRKALDRANAVIALSENTRVDLEELGVAPDRIRVIYGGGHVVPPEQIQTKRRQELKDKLKLPDQFILFVGTLQPRKNVPFLIRSFAKLKKESGLPHGLVLAGQRGQAAEEIDKLVQELGIATDVQITGYVEDWQLPLLYQMADLFVLPTLYEGFTLVTLEAMAYGIPVIATDTSSIREGVGDAAKLVPVNDDAALSQAIGSLLFDSGLRQQMIHRGFSQAKKFTWQRCAEETLHLYRELGTGSPRGKPTLSIP